MAKIVKERDEHIAEVVRLSRVNESENEAVNNLRKCVQDLRSSLSAKENELEQLSSQLDESKRMFNELTAAYDEKVLFNLSIIFGFVSCIHRVQRNKFPCSP